VKVASFTGLMIAFCALDVGTVLENYFRLIAFAAQYILVRE
jgi:hypothetical protein